MVFGLFLLIINKKREKNSSKIYNIEIKYFLTFEGLSVII